VSQASVPSSPGAMMAVGAQACARDTSRPELMIPVLLESPTPGLTQFGLTIYYFILFVLLSLASIAIALAPLTGDTDDLSDNR